MLPENCLKASGKRPESFRTAFKGFWRPLSMALRATSRGSSFLGFRGWSLMELFVIQSPKTTFAGDAATSLRRTSSDAIALRAIFGASPFLGLRG